MRILQCRDFMNKRSLRERRDRLQAASPLRNKCTLSAYYDDVWPLKIAPIIDQKSQEQNGFIYQKLFQKLFQDCLERFNQSATQSANWILSTGRFPGSADGSIAIHQLLSVTVQHPRHRTQYSQHPTSYQHSQLPTRHPTERQHTKLPKQPR